MERQRAEATNPWQLHADRAGWEPRGFHIVSGDKGKGEQQEAESTRKQGDQWELQTDRTGKEPHGSNPVSGAESKEGTGASKGEQTANKARGTG